MVTCISTPFAAHLHAVDIDSSKCCQITVAASPELLLYTYMMNQQMHIYEYVQ
jgi:hypothetical protein